MQRKDEFDLYTLSFIRFWIKRSFMTTLAQAATKLRELVEDNNQELFRAKSQRKMLVPSRVIWKLEDFGAVSKLTHKEWLP